jgi:hypothetical protein
MKGVESAGGAGALTAVGGAGCVVGAGAGFSLGVQPVGIIRLTKRATYKVRFIGRGMGSSGISVVRKQGDEKGIGGGAKTRPLREN